MATRARHEQLQRTHDVLVFSSCRGMPTSRGTYGHLCPGCEVPGGRQCRATLLAHLDVSQAVHRGLSSDWLRASTRIVLVLTREANAGWDEAYRMREVKV